MARNHAAPYHVEDAVPSGTVPIGAAVLDLGEQRVAELIEFRRDLHAHPELARQELRSTRVVAERLRAAGLEPRVQSSGTGLICDIDGDDTLSAQRGFQGRIALRADLDALPIQEAPGLSFRSVHEGVSHACGHDIHTTVVLGTGLALAEAAARGLPVPATRLIFQPSEEVMPGGALDMIGSGALDGVGRIVSLHCDPKVDAGRIGLRVGPLTAACDKLAVRLTGPGGHTSRPQLTVDLVHTLAHLVTELPAALSRRVDPRHGLSLVWGAINAGQAANAIPQAGEAHGTVRCMDERAWAEAPDLVLELVDSIAAVYGAKTELDYVRGVPPVVNDVDVIDEMRRAAAEVLGSEGSVSVEQSLGGEDFSWYLRQVPGAMARLGVRTPGDPVQRDLHQPSFLADESAIGVGVRFFTQLILGAGLD
ncbi:amidohydrolase [Actinospica sp. MGRD01-02]|uniref:Amidohydrolase n=1 Tax=Actinospica acidithermotolerans TaxID=2828514 RepID=A0A941EMA2_9ACTN|nr:amidohydrolase [Actinospica acidithermotolerans]MBR7830149.1 amidohydrolase [Actinospica acidithermotolerans]